MRLQKYLSAAAAAIALSAVTTTAVHAQSANFNVQAALTAQCVNTTGSTPTLDFGTYISGDPTVTVNNGASLTFACTRGLTNVTMDLDTAADKANTATGTVGTTAATGAGVLPTSNLYYTLSIAGSVTNAGNAPTAAGGLNAQDAAVYTFNISGTLPQQAGNCTGGTCAATSHQRTLTLTY